MHIDDFMNDNPIEHSELKKVTADYNAEPEEKPASRKSSLSETQPMPHARSRKKAGSKKTTYKTAAGNYYTSNSEDSFMNPEKEVKKSKSTLKRRILIFAMLEVLVLVLIFGYAYVLKQYNKIQRPEFDVAQVENNNLSLEKKQLMEEGYWTIAVFGVDSRDSSVGAGANSDVNIIVNINRKTGEIRLVSVFRDTYLKISDSRFNKINAAYCNGGPEQAIRALNENLDLNITDYCTFNWAAVANGINILGGVDVELSKAEFYYINSYITETVKATKIYSTHLQHAGMNHLDGVQAVAYARLRYMDNDYARTERQRKIIQLVLEKAKHADIATLNSLLGNTMEQVATNLTWQDGYDALANITKYSISETAGFPVARGEANIGKLGDCVIPQTLESNVIALHAFLFGEENYEPSDAVKNISKQISATSGMYNEGTPVGHVSTEGVIIPIKPKKASPSETNEDGEDISSGSDSNSKKKEVEYSISKDGYLIYVSGRDANGNKKYSYVLDDDGKRIKMVTTDEDGNTVYLYEVDEDGNFYFDLPENIKTPVDDDYEDEEQEGQPSTESEASYGPGIGPGREEDPSPAQGPERGPQQTESHHPGEERETTTAEAVEGTPGSNAPGGNVESPEPISNPQSQEASPAVSEGQQEIAPGGQNPAGPGEQGGTMVEPPPGN